MSYELKNIRNICLLGHGGNGKTSLAESMLSVAGMTDRQGKVTDGNTVSDFDPEEVRRQISISAAAMYANWQGHKINILDTPGFFDFVGEVYQALRVADCGVICVAAKDGLNVGAEKSWKYLKDAGKPRAIYISKLDEEHADFDRTFDDLRARFGNSVCALTAPIKDGDKYIGIVDVITKKAYKMDGNKRVEIPVPDSMGDRLEELYTELAESAAETSEELMEKYLDTMELSPEEISGALSAGVADGGICPVYCGSAFTGLGTRVLLDAIVSIFPTPAEGGKALDPNGPAKALVFKTISDQFGKFSLFKVVSGKVTADLTLTHARSGSQEKLGHI